MKYMGNWAADDAAIAELATSQHGLVTRDQLAALGFGRGAVEHRVARGSLRVVHRGVYAVGHRLLTRDGHRMAAVPAAGPGAVFGPPFGGHALGHARHVAPFSTSPPS